MLMDDDENWFSDVSNWYTINEMWTFLIKYQYITKLIVCFNQNPSLIMINMFLIVVNFESS